MISIDEEKNRILVWTAFSKFYLDTELNERDYDLISETLNKSPYSYDELMEIDLYEVFPVLQFNLLSVAGEWQNINEEWLVKRCRRQIDLRKSFVRRFLYQSFNKVFYWMRKKHIEAVKTRLKNI